MVVKILGILLLSVLVSQLSCCTTKHYTTERLYNDRVIFYDYEYWQTRTTNHALRLVHLKEQWIQLQILPEILFYTPDDIVDVTFKDQREITVRCTDEMFIENITNPPIRVYWRSCDPNEYYLLSFTAADTDDYFEHQIWMLGNIHNCDINTADEVFFYLLPEIGDIIGYQRFVFLVFKQPHKIHHFPEKNIYERRENMTIDMYVKKYNLTVPPAAGNFFLIDFTEWNYRHYTWTSWHYSWYTPDYMSTLYPTKKIPPYYTWPD